MNNEWKIFTTEKGLYSLENNTVEERSYYRMKVFLKNYFKNRYIEKQEKPKSFLFQLVMNLQGKRAEPENKVKMQETEQICEAYIDGHRMILSWNQVTGITFTVDTKDANILVKELSEALNQSPVPL